MHTYVLEQIHAIFNFLHFYYFSYDLHTFKKRHNVLLSTTETITARLLGLKAENSGTLGTRYCLPVSVLALLQSPRILAETFSTKKRDWSDHGCVRGYFYFAVKFLHLNSLFLIT